MAAIAHPDFSPFRAYGPQDYERLKVQIDLCAQLGRSYEFGDCPLPAGCHPSRAAVGFWRRDGGYLLYVKPSVRYDGGDRSAAALFRRGQQEFSTFEALTAFLRAPWGSADPLPLSHRALLCALRQAVVGQEAAAAALALPLFAHIGKANPVRPLSLIFYGPTGVGKSELGKHIAPILNRFCGEGAYQFVWTELNTFTEAHSVYRLTGAPPGYVGYDDEPVFEAVLRNPRTVFMFDELDKAHPDTLKAFMSILDEGRCAARRETGASGRTLDFRRCIFLFTTNADLSGNTGRLGFQTPEAADDPGRKQRPAGVAERVFLANERGRRAMLRHGALREIAGRFSGFVEFRPLDSDALLQITERQIAALGAEYGLQITSVAPELLASLGAQTAGAFSVRSHRSTIEWCFSAFFLERSELFQAVPVRLEGPFTRMRLVPAELTPAGKAPSPCGPRNSGGTGAPGLP